MHAAFLAQTDAACTWITGEIATFTYRCRQMQWSSSSQPWKGALTIPAAAESQVKSSHAKSNQVDQEQRASLAPFAGLCPKRAFALITMPPFALATTYICCRTHGHGQPTSQMPDHVNKQRFHPRGVRGERGRVSKITVTVTVVGGRVL